MCANEMTVRRTDVHNYECCMITSFNFTPPRPQPITAFHFYVSGKRFDVKRFTQPTYLHTHTPIRTHKWMDLHTEPCSVCHFCLVFLPRQQLCINDDPRFGKKKFEIISHWITCDFFSMTTHQDFGNIVGCYFCFF